MAAAEGTGIGEGAPARPGGRRRRGATAALVLGLYLIPALVAFWAVLPHLATWQPRYALGDPAKFTWFVGWVPFALAHHHDPFFTAYANVPFGVNLMDDTSVLGLGLLMAPVTLAFGPVASVNLLLILAYPLSAGAAYLLARRYVACRPAAFAGGLLYGYSPYMVGQGTAHLNLSFVPIPPLVFLALDELIIRQKRDPVRVGIGLGVLLGAQLLISTEILFTTALFAAVAVVVVALAGRRQWRAHLPGAARGLGVAGAVAVVLAAVPAYEALLGRRHVHGVIAGFDIYVSALLGPVLPTSLLVFGTHHMHVLADRIGGNSTENGSYLGPPLLILLVAAPFVWRSRALRAAALLAAVAILLSFGGHLHVGTSAGDRLTRHVILPGAILGRLPLFSDSQPVRYTLFMWLFLAVFLALVLERLAADPPPLRLLRARTGWRAAGPAAGLALLVFLPLLPRWPVPEARHVVGPAYFTTSAVDALVPGERTLVYPIAVPTDASAMYWQAASGFRFAMPGGYFVLPRSPDGSQFFAPTTTEKALTALAAGGPVDRSPALRRAVTAELRDWRITAVVARPDRRGAVDSFFTWLVGRPPDSQAGGMLEWYHLAWNPSG